MLFASAMQNATGCMKHCTVLNKRLLLQGYLKRLDMGDLQSAGMLSVNVLFSNSIQVCTLCYAVAAISGSGPLLCPVAVLCIPTSSASCPGAAAAASTWQPANYSQQV